MTIWKFPFDVQDTVELVMPEGASVRPARLAFGRWFGRASNRIDASSASSAPGTQSRTPAAYRSWRRFSSLRSCGTYSRSSLKSRRHSYSVRG